MTPLQIVYDSFLSKMLDDEWATWTEIEVNEDLYQLLVGAITHFRFPRIELVIEGDSFTADLSNFEIQILANYMKCEWLNRTILTWEHIKNLYSERDFSQANLLDKLKALSDGEWEKARKFESDYYRSINGKAYSYSKLAGNGTSAPKSSKRKYDKIILDAGSANSGI